MKKIILCLFVVFGLIETNAQAKEILYENDKDEFVIETDLNNYLGSYDLLKLEIDNYISYDAKMYINDEGLLIRTHLPTVQDINAEFDYEFKKKNKDVDWLKGQFFLTKDNNYAAILIDLDQRTVAIIIDETMKIFTIKSFQKGKVKIKPYM